jgi:prephenate dehydrogenase
MLIEKLAILGVGLIGGSLARALRMAGACRHVTGFGRGVENLDEAVSLGVIDGYSKDLSAVVDGADVVVLATPLSTTEPLLRSLADCLSPRTVITDVGSAKGSMVKAARAALGARLRDFVPGHPVAGTEQSGVAASFPGLFRDHLVILTPIEETGSRALELVTRMWEACGARVVSLGVDHHDRVLAATSHLPHVLAYALVDCLAGMEDEEEIFKFSAGGFRDFTRIASSHPGMWSDICLANREHLLKTLENYQLRLKELTRLIETGDRDGLYEVFSRVKQTRDRFIAELQTPPGKAGDGEAP